MPIYEYRCAGCKRKVSLFFGSFSVAESRAERGEIECPNCGSKQLSRMMSRVNMVRGGGDNGGFDASDGFDGGGRGMGDMGDMDDGMGGFDDPAMAGMMDGLDSEDPRAIARWARRMKDQMGGDMDMGPEFDQALARIEAGEDPDKVMEDIDPDALGGMGGDAGAGDDDEADFGGDFDEM